MGCFTALRHFIGLANTEKLLTGCSLNYKLPNSKQSIL